MTQQLTLETVCKHYKSSSKYINLSIHVTNTSTHFIDKFLCDNGYYLWFPLSSKHTPTINIIVNEQILTIPYFINFKSKLKFTSKLLYTNGTH